MLASAPPEMRAEMEVIRQRVLRQPKQQPLPHRGGAGCGERGNAQTITPAMTATVLHPHAAAADSDNRRKVAPMDRKVTPMDRKVAPMDPTPVPPAAPAPAILPDRTQWSDEFLKEIGPDFARELEEQHRHQQEQSQQLAAGMEAAAAAAATGSWDIFDRVGVHFSCSCVCQSTVGVCEQNCDLHSY